LHNARWVPFQKRVEFALLLDSLDKDIKNKEENTEINNNIITNKIKKKYTNQPYISLEEANEKLQDATDELNKYKKKIEDDGKYKELNLCEKVIFLIKKVKFNYQTGIVLEEFEESIKKYENVFFRFKETYNQSKKYIKLKEKKIEKNLLHLILKYDKSKKQIHEYEEDYGEIKREIKVSDSIIEDMFEISVLEQKYKLEEKKKEIINQLTELENLSVNLYKEIIHYDFKLEKIKEEQKLYETTQTRVEEQSEIFIKDMHNLQKIIYYNNKNPNIIDFYKIVSKVLEKVPELVINDSKQIAKFEDKLDKKRNQYQQNFEEIQYKKIYSNIENLDKDETIIKKINSDLTKIINLNFEIIYPFRTQIHYTTSCEVL
jgi:hypothetical protein